MMSFNKSKKSKNFDNHWLLAIFSNLSYNDLANYNDNGWQKHSERSNDQTGFFGVSFVNNDLKTFVIAFRGTNDPLGLPISLFSTDWRDNRCWVTGCIPYQYQDAKKFFNETSKEFPQHNKIVTGHSLGGGLAQLVAIENEVIAVTFDSPGTLLPAQRLFSKELISQNEGNIIAYVSTVNLVNTWGKHISKKLKQINDESFFDHCQENYANFTFQRHSMQVIIKKFDENTGMVPFKEIDSLERMGTFHGYFESRKVCGEAQTKEIMGLYNCTNLVISDNTQKLLDGEMVYQKDSVLVKRSFVFFKKNFYCNSELNGHNLINNKIYEEQLKNIQSLEYHMLYNDVVPSSYNNCRNEIAINKVYHEPKLDIYTISIIWDMSEEEVVSFYQARSKELCSQYSCSYGTGFSHLHDTPFFIHDEL